MNARRLLVLCYFYPPLAGGGVHRVLGFTRHLPAHGWRCTVICAGEEDYWVRDESLAAAIPPGTEVIRVPGGSALSAWLRLRRGEPARRSGSTFAGLRRLSDWCLIPDSYRGWARRAARAAERRIARGGIDALLSSSPPDSVHLAARAAARRNRVPWAADFRDPWIALHFREPPTAWHRRRQAALERSVIESADLVLAASRTHAEAIRGASRVEHLPNGYEPGEELLEMGSAAGAANPATWFEIVFTGTLSLMPDTEVLLEAVDGVLARIPAARRRLRVRLAGAYDSDYENRSVALGLRGIVTFAGQQPHAETLRLQRRADILMLWKPHGPGYRTMVPGKLYEYLDAARPIVALLDRGDEAAALVSAAGGTVLPPGARESLAEEIERRYRAWIAGAPTPSARPAWLDQHRRERLAGRLAGLLDGLVGAHP